MLARPMGLPGQPFPIPRWRAERGQFGGKQKRAEENETHVLCSVGWIYRSTAMTMPRPRTPSCVVRERARWRAQQMEAPREARQAGHSDQVGECHVPSGWRSRDTRYWRPPGCRGPGGAPPRSSGPECQAGSRLPPPALSPLSLPPGAPRWPPSRHCEKKLAVWLTRRMSRGLARGNGGNGGRARVFKGLDSAGHAPCHCAGGTLAASPPVYTHARTLTQSNEHPPTCTS